QMARKPKTPGTEKQGTSGAKATETATGTAGAPARISKLARLKVMLASPEGRASRRDRGRAGLAAAHGPRRPEHAAQGRRHDRADRAGGQGRGRPLPAGGGSGDQRMSPLPTIAALEAMERAELLAAWTAIFGGP